MHPRVGERIKERRKVLRLTQRDLALLCDTSRGSVSRWEKGQVDTIPQSKIIRLAEVLKCDPVWLMDFVPEAYDDSLKHVMDVIETEEEFIQGLKEVCLAYGNIGKNFTDTDWEDIVQYITFKAMRKK